MKPANISPIQVIHYFPTESGSTIHTFQYPANLAAELVTALRQITEIQSTNPGGIKSWSELVINVQAIARTALKTAEARVGMESAALTEALDRIAALAPAEANDTQHSWKYLTVPADVIAGGAIIFILHQPCYSGHFHLTVALRTLKTHTR